MKGRMPTDGLLTIRELMEISGASESVIRKDLAAARVLYRDFFACRWYSAADIVKAFPQIDPATTPSKRGGCRRRKGGSP